MTQLTENVFAVEVPDKYAQLCIDDVFNELYWWSYGGVETVIPLPPGNWQFICTTKVATEEIAAGIVQIISNGKISGMPQYRRYDRDPVKDTPAKCWTRDSRHSLETLITSKGLDGNKNHVLLKKGNYPKEMNRKQID